MQQNMTTKKELRINEHAQQIKQKTWPARDARDTEWRVYVVAKTKQISSH